MYFSIFEKIAVKIYESDENDINVHEHEENFRNNLQMLKLP